MIFTLVALVLALLVAGLLLRPYITAHAEGEAKGSLRLREGGIAMLAVSVGVIALGGVVYMALGKPGLEAQPHAERLEALKARNPETLSLPEVLHVMKAHMRDNPDSVAGWEHLGSLYMMAGAHEDAVHAFGRSISVSQAAGAEHPSGKTLALLGEAVTLREEGRVTAKAREAFQDALRFSPGDVTARFYLALEREQAGAPGEAIEALNALKADHAGSPGVVQRIDMELARLTGEAPSTSGPSQADVASAMQMAPEDRRAMIEGMVAGLAARLEETPDDHDGWVRLIRSHDVLGNKEKARAALDRALAAADWTPEQDARLRDLGAELGLSD